MAEDDSLFDHLSFILRHWPVVAGTSLGFAIVAAVVSLFVHRSTAEAMLRVGSVAGAGYVEAPNEIVARVRSNAFLKQLEEAHPALAAGGYSLDAALVEGTGLIRFAATAPDQNLARDLIEWASAQVRGPHQLIFEAGSRLNEDKISELERAIEYFDRLLRDADTGAPSEPSVELQRLRWQEQLNRHQSQLYEMRLRMDANRHRPSELVEKPTVRESNLRTKAIAAGVVGGLSLAILLIYLREALRRTRRAGKASG